MKHTLSQLKKANGGFVIIWAYPTALKRQLLSEGMTLLTTIPSMLIRNRPLKQSQQHSTF